MRPQGRLLILNGASSTGKTTLASGFRDTRAAAGEFWLLMGIDDYVSKLPLSWWDAGLPGGPGAHAKDGLRFETTGGGLQLVVGDTCRRLLRAYHRAVAAAVRSGLDVVVDEVVFDDDLRRDWCDVLDGLEPVWVAVRCAPEVAQERERRRGDRPIGMTSTHTDTVHRSIDYAFEVDTSDLGPEDALTDLLRKLSDWESTSRRLRRA